MQLATESKLFPQTSTILCYYFNPSNKIQLIRVWNLNSYSLEKILFPQQRILFEAMPGGMLEVHTKQQDRQILEEVFSCLNLQVNSFQLQLATI